MKKLFAMFLALAMVLTMMSFASAEDVTINFWYWAETTPIPRPCRT